MNERPPRGERMSEEVWAFFSYIFDGNIPEDTGTDKYRFFQASVQLVKERIDSFTNENEGSLAKRLYFELGNNLSGGFLTGCDPEQNLFVVIGPGED